MSETELAASVEEVFAFHENPQNIRKISPSFLQILHVEANQTAQVGDVFILKLRVFGFPLNWKGRWSSVTKPSTLIDTAALFPFQTWKHEHLFVMTPNGCQMTDTVSYSLPFGWLGQLAGATLFRLQLVLMFAGRHAATRKYFLAQR